MTALPPDAVADLYKLVAELEQRLESSFAAHDEAIARLAATAQENARLRRELGVARDRQNASADILGTIANASGDAAASLQQIAETTARLFDAASVTIRIANGNEWSQTIRFGAGAERIDALVPAEQRRAGGRNLPGTVFRENRQIHIPDLDNIDPEMADWPVVAARAAGTRTVAGTPLRRRGKAIGALLVFRDRLAPFTDDELALQQSFADQAAIALENARLINETREALSRQTATADILRVISQSPTDVQPVFDAIVLSAVRLLGCDRSFVLRCDGVSFWTAARAGPEGSLRIMMPEKVLIDPEANFPSRAIAERKTLHLPDWSVIDLPEFELRIHEMLGYNSTLYLPLLREGECIGLLGLARKQAGAFDENQIALAESFRDQALIAIENTRLFNETREALERQTATSDILKVIASSPSDVQPVFEAIAESAKRLLGGFMAAVFRFIDGMNHLAAFTSTNPSSDEALKASFPRPIDQIPHLASITSGKAVHFADTELEEPLTVELGRARGFRSIAFTPLVSNGSTIGMIAVTRREPGPFADHHVQLLQTFADQAVIAIENVRLFNETREALERQTATSDILKVIASSPSDVQPVFDVIVERAVRLCGARMGRVYRYDGDQIHLVGGHGLSAPGREGAERPFPRPASEDTIVGRVMLSRRPNILADLDEDDTVPPLSRQMISALGARSQVTMPMLLAGQPIGAITLSWAEPRGYTDQTIALLQTFADQAVIAIENVRLFNEVTQRTEDLSESLQQQTAVGDVLKIISRSAFDLQPVLDTLVNTAAILCDTEMAFLMRREGDVYRAGAAIGFSSEYIEFLRSHPLSVDRGSITGRAVLERRTVQILDVATDPEYKLRESITLAGQHTALCVPLLRENEPIGTIVLARQRVEAFTQKQIDLVTTFADQAVIAIENVRLFNEVQQRTEDLSESLQRQTATADVLKVISRSAFDLQTVLDTLTESAARLCGADMAAIARQDAHGGYYHATNYNFSIDWVRILNSIRIRPERGSVVGRVLLARKAVQIPDVQADPEYTYPDLQKAAGYRTLLGVPLLRGNEPIGVLFLGHKTVQPFTEKQIELVSTFADQAVIAIENVRLFDEVQARTRDLTEALTYQTGSAKILSVIASSPTEVGPVLNAIVESACELCEAYDAVVLLKDGDDLRFSAHHGPIAVNVEKWPIGRGWTAGRAFLERKPVHVRDMLSDEGAEFPDSRELSRHTGAASIRTILSVPLLSENESIGTILLRRTEVQSFSDKQIALLQTFADQAVIAIGNARLFDEVQAKTRDLAESLQQQTATSDVLKVISRSAFDLQTVLDTLVESAARLCSADQGMLLLMEADVLKPLSYFGPYPDKFEFRKSLATAPHRGNLSGRAVLEGQIAHVADVLADPEFTNNPWQQLTGFRAMLAVPLMRQGQPIGAMALSRTTPGLFADRQIELVTTFADQAVIAIENVRLFDEVQAKTRDLSEALTYQTGSGNILKVIASSPTEVGPVLQAIVDNACEVCDAYDAVVLLKDGDDLRFNAHHGPIPMDLEKWPINRHWTAGRAFLDRKPVHLHDLLAEENDDFSDGRELSRRMGHRSILSVPLLREGESIGVIVLRRTEVHPFSDKQIALLQTFADQAVIAIGNVRLFEEVQAKTRDLSEALTYQTGSANILRVIASSPTDVGPVLQAIVESSCELCGAYDAVLRLKDGDILRMGAHHGPIPVDMDRWTINRGWTAGRAVVDQKPVHVHDLLSEEGDEFPEARARARTQGHRTVLSVPLMRKGESIGAITLRRNEVNPFGDKQINLLQTFADQAVIAIGNVRLFEEVQAKTRDLSEALTYQTGSANILKVIASSPTDVEPVLSAIVESACELCEAPDAVVLLKDGDDLRHGAHHGPISSVLEKRPISRNWVAGRAMLDRKAVQVHDILATEGDEFPETRDLARRTGNRGFLCVPLLREGESIGVIALRRTEVQPFSDKQIALLQTFADQAVIAIGNVRLFEEVQAKTHDLTEALTYQTGSGNILRVIASSPTDVKPVLKAIVESACELCEANDALATLRDGDDMLFQAQHGSIPVVWERQPINRQWVSGRAVIDRRPVHVHDLLAAEGEGFPDSREFSQQTNVRTVLSVPLLREGESIGAIVLRRTEVRPFSDKQIALLQTFADQAVIAIGNVRLFEEVQARTRDLTESLQQQTATADVLKVISASPGELEPVFQSMLENAVRLCEAKFAMLFLYEEKENVYRAVGKWNLPPAWSEFLGKNPLPADPRVPLGRVAITKQPVQIADVLLDQAYIDRFPGMVAVAELGGARTLLQVPMLRENELVGAFGIYRQEVRPFTDKQVALVRNFAAQAVIAIENARLLNELRQRTDDLTKSLDDLRTAQDRLIQTEKLASLGQLTAGIAHEIKNPLNFVNNFAALSAELTDELNDVLKQVTITDKSRAEVDELTGLLKDNLEKVVQHGKRADSIVKNMLLHSREGSGEHRPADINALVDESLNLAYHGARAERPDFNITLQRDFDASAGMIEMFPQEITRVLLNLVSNGFYAVTRRKRERGPGFDPVLSAATRNLGDAVEIRIRDNGTGIPPEVKDKMFNPFFTTKPAGEGTGLGLSMSHDIIVKQHGGTIDVATEPGQFTEFSIVLPRTSNSPNKNRG